MCPSTQSRHIVGSHWKMHRRAGHQERKTCARNGGVLCSTAPGKRHVYGSGKARRCPAANRRPAMKLLTMILASTALVLLATPALAQKPGATMLNRAPAIATAQVIKPTTVAPTVGGTPVARSSTMGSRLGGVFGGLRALGAIDCTADTCTCHGDVECNDMFSGAYCKWPTGPITPGDSCNNGVCTCKRL